MAIIYKCSGKRRGVCDFESDRKWLGRCPGCECYYDIITSGAEAGRKNKDMSSAALALRALEHKVKRISTGLPGFDHVIGGEGLVPGSTYVISGPRGTGKCLGRGTLVMRFDGKIIPVEEVRTGDVLIGPDSTPRHVLSTAQGIGPLYKIVPIKGAPWVCNDVHVLTLFDAVKKIVFDMPLDEYLRFSGYQKQTWKLFKPKRVNFAARTFTSEDRPVTPYFLGVWLGDGTKHGQNGRLAGVQISKPDAEIEAACRDEAARFGLHITTTFSYNDCPTYRLVGVKGLENPLLEIFRNYMKNGNHIPDAYKYAEEDVRKEVLAGLLDTDGHYDRRCNIYDFVQLDRTIAEDTAFLARSLGLCVTIRPKTVDGTVYQRLTISGDATHLPLRIARKQARPREQKKNPLITGFSVEPLGEGEFFGFELDGDGRFLLGDFTVTHNTTLLLQLCDNIAKERTKVIFASGEMNADDLGGFISRFGIANPFLEIMIESDIEKIVERADEINAKVVVLDSLQKMFMEDVKGSIGSRSQGSAVAEHVTYFGKKSKTAFIVVSHVNKEGDLSASSSVGHEVDTLLEFDPAFKFDEDGDLIDASKNLRRLYTIDKNRNGPTPREAWFEMQERGVVEVTEKKAEEKKRKKSRLVLLPSSSDEPGEN